MGYRLDGIVTFEFSGIRIDDDDPIEARHIVETMSIGELFEYMDNVVIVEVTNQGVVR